MFGGTVVEFNYNYTYVILITSFIPNLSKICSAVGVNELALVSAAHCFVGNTDPSLVSFHILKSDGKYNTNKVSRIFIHPDYVEKRKNDIALIKSTKAFRVEFLSLPKKPFDEETECIIAGYGSLSEEDETDPKLSVLHVTPYKKEICSYVTNESTNLICLGSLGPVGPCHGDSGGPLVCKRRITAILSRGVTVGQGCGYSMFSIMFYEDLYWHLNWIKTTLLEINSSASPKLTILLIVISLY